MSDALLSEMSRAAREHVLADPRWEKLAAGTLADADRDDLLEKARAAGIDEETIAAFGPRDEAFDDRLAEAALAAMKKRPAEARETPTAGDARAAGGPEGERARVLPFRSAGGGLRGRGRGARSSGGSSALAAARGADAGIHAERGGRPTGAAVVAG